MDITASLEAVMDGEALVRVVNDLGTYPSWLDIVSRAVPIEVGPDEAPAWEVQLKGQIGPLRRLKRLRMVRVATSDAGHVRFERSEVDGRSHSPWVLDARITTAEPVRPDKPVRLDMSLHYGGNLWVPMLDRMLRDEIERSRQRLVAAVNQEAARH